MEERKVPPVQRNSIDGIKVRQTSPGNPAAGNPTVPDAPKTPSQPPQEKQQTKQSVVKEPKKSKNLLAVTLAVIILIGLSALAVYVRLQQNTDGRDKAASGQESVSEENNPAEAIDQTIKDIDQLDNQPDSSGEGLSNEQLGL